MDRLLQRQELDSLDKTVLEPLDEFIAQAYNLESSLVFFPIRHHSPVCSYHLLRTLDRYQPDVILIEGPSNTHHLIDGLLDDEAKLPLSIYYTYQNKDEEKYLCYYPMLGHSPEYVALLEGKKRSIPTAFIDLPYEAILKASQENKGIREKMSKKEYNDDTYLASGKMMKDAMKKGGVRHFQEFWEKYFELKNLNAKTEDYIKDMLTYCYLLRQGETQQDLLEDGCLARETFMAAKIKEYQQSHKRILVLTGGFHTWGILNYLNNQEELRIRDKELEPKEKSEAYLIPYSYQHSDALSGYASGMPYSYFYSRIWKDIKKNYASFLSGDYTAKELYHEQVAYFITKCGRELRKEGEAASTDDSIQALRMSAGLADLRQKDAIGVYEMIEGIRSAFIKGEYNEVNNSPLKVLQKILIGDKIGKLSSQTILPPLVEDFKKLCTKFKLDIRLIQEQQKVLEIYQKPLHQQISYFFHQMDYMDCGFVKKLKGPDLLSKKNMSIKRETWSYCWRPEVERKLIENSLYGGTVREVILEKLKMESAECATQSGASAKVLLRAVMMGIGECQDTLFTQVGEAIEMDQEFFSLVACSQSLQYLSNMPLPELLLQGVMKLQQLTCQKSFQLLQLLKEVKSEESLEYAKAIKHFNFLALEGVGDTESFIESFTLIRDLPDMDPLLEGAIEGILFGWDEVTYDAILAKIKGYMSGSGEERQKCAPFLRGLFLTGKDILLINPQLLQLLDQYIDELDEELFMEILPELCYAFSAFMPREIASIADQIASIHGTIGNKVITGTGIDAVDYKDFKERDQRVKGILEKWGILHE